MRQCCIRYQTLRESRALFENFEVFDISIENDFEQGLAKPVGVRPSVREVPRVRLQ